jgi:hypothetical protein
MPEYYPYPLKWPVRGCKGVFIVCNINISPGYTLPWATGSTTRIRASSSVLATYSTYIELLKSLELWKRMFLCGSAVAPGKFFDADPALSCL